MESLEPQVQDSVTTNGAPEASTSSPASEPSALTPALPDLSRTAEQGKDAGSTSHTIAGGTTKKYSPFNINKRFMEQNSSAPGSSQMPPSSATSKIASTTIKSPPPPPASHSRLVDAKLAKLPSSSTSTGAGWTRPSSTTPTLTPSPGPGGMSSVPPAPAPGSHGPPLLTHVGKVIQPQHRGGIQPPSRSKPESTNGSSKLAWRNVKQGESATSGIGAQSEFPTAAEVAQGRLNGVQEKKQTTQTPANPSSATTEADTFRGVHLDPNAHHWDEMEEDNDDFLGGVIEFGDGRQYQIQPIDVSQTTQDPSPASVPAPETSSPHPQSPSAPAGINKEDRFSDDIDRSWPRSAGLSSNTRPRVGPPAGASASSSSSLSPQESSRMLFNWSNNNRIPPPDGRIGRDAPMHNNVQLLQKQGLDRPRELRRDTGSSQGTEDRRWERGRRSSNATTTHSALSAGRDSSRESLRQLPPHLASTPKSLPLLYTHQLPHAHPPSSRHSSTSEPWRQERSLERSPAIPSPSYPSSHFTSPTTPSAVVPSPQALIAAPADIELVRKAAMHTAAECAKLRRQQDEEEREREQERARKRAAEMGKSVEKEKAQEHPTAQVPTAQPLQETRPEPASPQHPTGPIPDRQPVEPPASSKHPPRGPENGPTAPITGFRSQRGTQSDSQPPSSSNAETSWRTSAAPLPPLSPRRPSPATTRVSFPSASQVLDVQLLDPSNDDSLEEVEFNDLGKFVGVEPSPEETAVPPVQQGDISTKDDGPRTKSELEPFWRRKASPAPPEEQPSVVISNALPEASSESPAGGEADPVLASPSMPTASIGTVSPAKSLAEGSLPSQTLVVPSSLPSQRSPRALSYREDLISTFEDTMSRIKGAMQTKPHRNAMGTEHHPTRAAANNTSYSAERPRFGRGAPPGSRSHLPHVPEPDEPFTTMTELDVDVRRGQPNRVKLPSPRARALEPLSKREFANLKRSILPLRWDVLSWDSLVEGMPARDYSVNDVLFDKPQLGHPRFLVKLPPSGSYLIKRSSPSMPKVHLPAKPLVNKNVPGTGAFGRPRVADESSTWRRTLPPIPDQVESTTSSEGLVTRTGSSPPDTDKASDVTPSVETETTQPAQLSTKFRAEPKMPVGAGVAFYRESTSRPSVSFTVSSELEDVRQLEAPVMPLSEEPAPLSQPLGDPKGNEVDGSSTLLAPREKAESKSSDGSSDTPLTPPTSTGWTKGLVKDSPVRKPDPEQLKLLWSQTSEKAGVPGVNSLEGITDDLPSVPFMLQEVKSEDGETPPPTSSNGPGPSRMSLHDVTRAFQQVPPPPAGSITGKASPQLPAIQPSTSGSNRHPAFPQPSQPVHSVVGGPAYPPYSSPMLSHSPAPTLMYPHPMAPNQIMGGPSGQYPQPMWFPMAAPGGQTPGGPVRPLHSPYPHHASYIQYPSPGAYAPSQPGHGPPPNGTQNRSRPGAHGLSPNMSHSRAPATVPMYQGSPVLVHPQAVMHVQSSYPGAMPAGRGVPMQASHATPGPHGGGYTPTTHAPYPRPPW